MPREFKDVAQLKKRKDTREEYPRSEVSNLQQRTKPIFHPHTDPMAGPAHKLSAWCPWRLGWPMKVHRNDYLAPLQEKFAGPVLQSPFDRVGHSTEIYGYDWC